MCFGLEAIAGIGMSVMQASASASAKQAQYKQQVQEYQQNVTNAEAADRSNQVQLNLRQEQEQEAAVQKIHDQSVQGAIQRSRYSASAAGAGVAGISIDNILNDIRSTVDTNQGVLRENAANTSAQLQTQKDASVLQDQSRINSKAVPLQPDTTGDALSVAGAGLKAIGSFTQGGGASMPGLNLFGGM